MGVLRDESIVLNKLTSATDADGQWLTTPVPFFTARAVIQDIKSEYQVVANTRVYSEYAKFKVRKTPAWMDVSVNNSAYAVTFRGRNYKLVDVLEDSNRGWVVVVGQTQTPAEAL